MLRLTFLVVLLLLNVSNFYLSRHFLSPLLPSELLMILKFLSHWIGESGATGFLKYDLLLTWLGSSLILLQILFWTYRRTNPNEGLPLGWFVFSFTIPFLAADYSFDYQTQSFGEYMDGRVRLLTHIDSYPNRFGQQLVAALKKRDEKDIQSSLIKVTAPKLGKLPSFGTLSDSCSSQFIRTFKGVQSQKNSLTDFSCELLSRALEEAVPDSLTEIRCEAGPTLKTLYALDQGMATCPLTKVDLAHTLKVCDLMKSYDISPITTCRLLKLIPVDQLEALRKINEGT